MFKYFRSVSQIRPLKLTLTNLRGLSDLSNNDLVSNKLKDLTESLTTINKDSPFYPTNVITTNSDEDIMRTFLNLAGQEVPPGDPKWFSMLNEKRTVNELPEAPKNLNSVKLTAYIEQLSHLQTRTNRKLRDRVQQLYWKILNSHLLQDVESYNIILRFFAVNYNFNAVKSILFSMFKAGIKPNTNTFNSVLSQLKYARHKYKSDLVKMYLNQMKVYNLIPDRTTWYILFGCLSEQKVAFYEEMLRKNIPMKPIINEVLQFQYNYGGMKIDQLVEYLKSQEVPLDKKILSTLVRLCTEADRPEDAIELLDEYVGPDKQIRHVDFNSLICMVDYFAAKKKQLYNAMAVMNYFVDHYDLSIKVYRCYEVLAKTMIEYPNFSNWSILTRRFYLDSMYSVDQSLLSDKTKGKLKSTAKRYGIPDFKLETLRRSEFDETAQVFEELRWAGKPEFELGKNDSEFREAARYMQKEPTSE
ncbi:DEKNAAC102869 [Brettanomyces naardenensis]|uniref:Mitochondrial 15S rRNA processing factor CCM1 n=1 Tax=Brettanomyces naardenensis TaxID=13370 RepID=A0A448YLM7_BRENA|nr:DEKNAAC102869 [Brettanomyces naardenensis]